MTTSIPLNDEQRARTMSREDASHPHPHALPEPHAVLGLKEAVAIIVGIVIGAGIFKAPSLVAGMTGSVGWMLGAWALGIAVLPLMAIAVVFMVRRELSDGVRDSGAQLP